MTPDFEVVPTENGLLIKAKLPELCTEQVEITVEGKLLRIVRTKPNGCGPFEKVIEVPIGYSAARAVAHFLRGNYISLFRNCNFQGFSRTESLNLTHPSGCCILPV